MHLYPSAVISHVAHCAVPVRSEGPVRCASMDLGKLLGKLLQVRVDDLASLNP